MQLPWTISDRRHFSFPFLLAFSVKFDWKKLDRSNRRDTANSTYDLRRREGKDLRPSRAAQVSYITRRWRSCSFNARLGPVCRRRSIARYNKRKESKRSERYGRPSTSSSTDNEQRLGSSVIESSTVSSLPSLSRSSIDFRFPKSSNIPKRRFCLPTKTIVLLPWTINLQFRINSRLISNQFLI